MKVTTIMIATCVKDVNKQVNHGRSTGIVELLPVNGICKSLNKKKITMSYKQLNEGQRYQIEAYLREGFS